MLHMKFIKLVMWSTARQKVSENIPEDVVRVVSTRAQGVKMLTENLCFKLGVSGLKEVGIWGTVKTRKSQPMLL